MLGKTAQSKNVCLTESSELGNKRRFKQTLPTLTPTLTQEGQVRETRDYYRASHVYLPQASISRLS